MATTSQLPIPLDNIPDQLQPLERKPDHIALSLASSSFNLARDRLPTLHRHSQGAITRCTIPSLPASWPSSPALTESIRATERLARVFCEPGDNDRRWSFVVFDVRVRPACKGDSRFECVEGEAAFVIG